MEQLFIPDKIKVGYQERADTYTKRLAYVIYYDKKGVLRKEASWRGWIDKGNDGREWVAGAYVTNPEKVRPPLDTHDFENVPTEGFVLNKKAGGYSTGWNHRATYCRIYDPRGFEFEISIPNLLFIFQECDSNKGKGLVGEFVYAWEGKDLVLLPAHCEEYKKSRGYTDLQGKKVAAKSLIPGAVYTTKREESLIYLGKYPWYAFKNVPVDYEGSYYSRGNRKDRYSYNEISSDKQFIFFDESSNMVLLNGLTSLAECKSETPVSNFAELMDLFVNNIHSSAPVSVESADAPAIDWQEEDFKDMTKYRYSGHVIGTFYKEVEVNKWVEFDIREYSDQRYPILNQGTPEQTYDYNKPYRELKGYHINAQKYIEWKDGKLSTDRRGMDKYEYKNRIINDIYAWNRHREETKMFTRDEVLALKRVDLFVNLDNGKRLQFKKYN